MQRVKDFMVYPLLATILWLLWVLGQQAGLAAVMLVLLGMMFLSLLLWGLAFSRASALRTGFWVVIVSLLVVMPVLTYKIDRGTVSEANLAPAFSLDTLNALRAKDQPVFVYATADWCITCKVNEGTTLHRREIQQFFVQNNIAVLRADWTRRDDTITRYLETFNRSGVPVYVFYPSGDRPPVLLPQILTPARVLQTLTPLLKDSPCSSTSC
jgi:thiol:disulfide interchange protein DsbD